MAKNAHKEFILVVKGNLEGIEEKLNENEYFKLKEKLHDIK